MQLARDTLQSLEGQAQGLAPYECMGRPPDILLVDYLPPEPFGPLLQWQEAELHQGAVNLGARWAVFTDGSLTGVTGKAGVFICPSHPYNTTVEIPLAQSSTEVELIAILYVIWMAPSASAVTIVTDSQASITLLQSPPHWAGSLSWLQHTCQKLNQARQAPVELLHIHAHQDNPQRALDPIQAGQVARGNEKFGAQLEGCLQGNCGADRQAAQDPKATYQGIICPDRQWQLAQGMQQAAWSPKMAAKQITAALCWAQHQAITQTAKAVPKDWTQVDTTLCSRVDPHPRGKPPATSPASFLQDPMNGGRHLLQLCMGALQLKGHPGAHMLQSRYKRLAAHTQAFWEDPQCPCGLGPDSPAHRVLQCLQNSRACR